MGGENAIRSQWVGGRSGRPPKERSGSACRGRGRHAASPGAARQPNREAPGGPRDHPSLRAPCPVELGAGVLGCRRIRRAPPSLVATARLIWCRRRAGYPLEVKASATSNPLERILPTATPQARIAAKATAGDRWWRHHAQPLDSGLSRRDPPGSRRQPLHRRQTALRQSVHGRRAARPVGWRLRRTARATTWWRACAGGRASWRASAHDWCEAGSRRNPAPTCRSTWNWLRRSLAPAGS
jgi:hypothetical protein